MDLHLTIPLWPLAAFLSLVVAGLVGSFVAAMMPSHPREEDPPGVGMWVFWLASLGFVGGCVWVIWRLFGYPLAGNLITIIYAGVCTLFWLASACNAIRLRFQRR